MKLKLTHVFLIKLKNQVDFLSKDKPSFARKFKAGVYVELRKAATRPQIHRKSVFLEYANCHDVIYKGHTIIVRETKYYLEVLDLIYKQSFAPEDLQ